MSTHLLLLVFGSLALFDLGLFIWWRGREQARTALEQGNALLHQRVAPFSWIVQQQDTGTWRIVPTPRVQWEIMAGIHWRQMPAWRRGLLRGAAAVLMGSSLIIASFWVPGGWGLAMASVGLAWLGRCVHVIGGAWARSAQERLVQCQCVPVRPWARAWQAQHPQDNVPVEIMPDEIHNQVQVMVRLLSNPQQGNAHDHLADLRRQLPPRIIGELTRATLWEILTSVPGGHTAQAIGQAIALGAPVDAHAHTRQTNLFYSNQPVLTAFIGQHGSASPVRFRPDTLAEVVEALQTSPAFDINAADPHTGRPALAELILATQHYQTKPGRRNEGAVADLLDGVALLIQHGAQLALALSAIPMTLVEAEPILLSGKHPQIREQLALTQQAGLETSTPQASASRTTVRL